MLSHATLEIPAFPGSILMTVFVRRVLCPLVILVCLAPAALSQIPFAFRDGDRVVLLGATFIERAQQFGHLEAVLTADQVDCHITFRNLGWSGDTVFAESRGMFDTPADGYQRMIDHVKQESPTVIVLCYGQNEALGSSIPVDRFATQLQQLLDDLKPVGARIVLLSPHELLPVRSPIPSPSRFNKRISGYVDVIRSIATTNGAAFVDLFSDFTADLWAADRSMTVAPDTLPRNLADHPDLLSMATARWSDNGLHFNETGYRAVSRVVANRMTGGSAETVSNRSTADIRIDLSNQSLVIDHGDIRDVVWSIGPASTLQFEFRTTTLSAVPNVLHVAGGSSDVAGTVSSFESTQPLIPIPSDHGAEFMRYSMGIDPQYERLRQLIIMKNQLYFHRWRPQNMTYLFGFRKHEQGQNAAEIPQFDPLVKQLEDDIREMKRPEWRRVTLTMSSR